MPEIQTEIELTYPCEGCGGEFTEEKLTDQADNPYCAECLAQLFGDCYSCSMVWPNEELREAPDSSRCYCTECYHDRYSYCESCDSDYRTDEFITVCNGESFCESCVRNNYWYCDRCTEWYYDGDSCRHRDEGEIESLMHSYSFKPSLTYLMTEDQDQQRLFAGVELEVTMPKWGDSADALYKYFQAQRWLYLKGDGSIEPECDDEIGVELVTHPFTEAWYKANSQEISNMLRLLRSSHCNSGADVNCGMHVHLSKAAFTSVKHLYKFVRLFYESYKFTLWFSRRDQQCLDTFAKFDNDPGKLMRLARKIVTGKKSGDRYVAVNLEPHNTVEVRVFAGTLDELHFRSNIEIMFAAHAFSRKELAPTLQDFREWTLTQSQEYPSLAKVLINYPGE